MRRLRIGVLDLVTKAPNRSLYARLMHANLASIMPQVIAVWCEQEGHDVRLRLLHRAGGPARGAAVRSRRALHRRVHPVGPARLRAEQPVPAAGRGHRAGRAARALLPRGRAASTSTTCSASPTARWWPTCCGTAGPHRPLGRAPDGRAPADRPADASQERWKFVEPTLAKAPTIKIVPMIGSLGCPYTCSFCIDSTVDYQPLELRRSSGTICAFLLTKMKNPIVGWHDPTSACASTTTWRRSRRRCRGAAMRHIAESSLSLLSEPHLQAAAGEQLPGDSAGDRVVVRPGQQVQDPAHRAWTRSSRSPSTST